MSLRHLFAAAGSMVCLAASSFLLQAMPPAPAEEPNLTDEQREDFLRTARVVNSKQLSKGITAPWRLTLSDGTITHDAAFQSVDVRKTIQTFQDGRTEIGFRDSYHYNLAAREVAKLVGLADMVPVTVARKWNGDAGALSWWVPWKWDEGMRRQQRAAPPDLDAWNQQMYRARVFIALIENTDPNLGNFLITEDWKLWMIDFTRAFRQDHALKNVQDLTNCDRKLLEALRRLDGKELQAKTKDHLNGSEVKALLARRDKIVAHFDQLVAQRGEAAVLY